MKAFLNLIRWKNILLVAATMFAMKYAIIIPIYKFFDIALGLSDIGFYLLVFSAMLTLAAGNIINDYFDRKTDMINRPKKVIVGFKIKRRQAIFMHSAFSLLGVISGFIVSFIIGKPLFGLLFIFISVLLWTYSSTLKKKVVIGNLTVALLTALIPLLVGISEYYAFERSIPEWTINNIRAIKISFQTIIGFSIFAFLFNFIQELIKDCKDYRGDKKTGIKTIPVSIGLKKSNYIISFLSLITIVTILVIWHAYLEKLSFFDNENISIMYLYALIILPSSYLFIRSLFGISRKKYTHLHQTVKFIMIFGMLFSIIFSFAVYDKI